MDRAKANDKVDGGKADRIIMDELERLLASPMFVRSPVLSRLLQYLVDHRLRGGHPTPKAYAIATEALGRSADFDPAVDSYPRVMVGRLRTLLDRYYGETPWVHRLRVPQGSYEVVVQKRAAPPARTDADAVPTGETRDNAVDSGGAAGSIAPRPPVAPPGDRRPRWWVAVLIVLGTGLFMAWWFLDGRDRLTVRTLAPMPLLEVSVPSAGDTPASRALARALDGRLRDGLRRFDLVDLRSAGAPTDVAPENQPDYRLDVSLVRSIAGPVEVTLMLDRVSDQRTIWSQQFDLTGEQVPEFREIDPAIAQIAGDYGIIVRDQIQRQPKNFAPGFPCLAQYNRLRQMRRPATATQVEACLRATLKADPIDPVPLAALSLLRFGDWQKQAASTTGKAAFAEGRLLAETAYENGPKTTAGLFAKARANFYTGNCLRGNAMGDAAIRLNPFDPDIAGFLGLFKVVCGQLAEGEGLLQRSLDLDGSYPGVPAVTLAFLLSQRGEQDQALDVLDQMASPSNMEPQYMMVRAIVHARQGDVPGARRLWQRLLDHTRQPANAPPEQVLRQFMIAPTVIQRAADALRDSGVVSEKSAT